MSNFDNTNSGVLFKNKNKKKDTHADYNGTINVNGKEYWLNAWIKEAGEKAENPGQKFFSLSVQEKKPKSGGTAKTNPESGPDGSSDKTDFVDSEIPF